MSKEFNKPMSPQEINQMSDSNINYTDIPQLDENFWANATVSSPRTKPNVSLRLSPEVIDFFKEKHPKGYTSHMASVLAMYVQAQTPQK